MAMAGVEVKGVDDTERQGNGVDDAGGGRRGVPVLKLRVCFDGQVVGQVVVQSRAGGVHERIGVEVLCVAEDETAVLIVDCAAAEEEVDVRVEPSDGVLDPGSEKEVFLAADMPSVDGVGAANLKGWPELAEVENGEVGACDDAQVLAACEIGKGAGESAKGGELKLLGSSGSCLSVRSLGQAGDDDGKGQPYQCFSIHSIL